MARRGRAHPPPPPSTRARAPARPRSPAARCLSERLGRSRARARGPPGPPSRTWFERSVRGRRRRVGGLGFGGRNGGASARRGAVHLPPPPPHPSPHTPRSPYQTRTPGPGRTRATARAPPLLPRLAAAAPSPLPPYCRPSTCCCCCCCSTCCCCCQAAPPPLWLGAPPCDATRGRACGSRPTCTHPAIRGVWVRRGCSRRWRSRGGGGVMGAGCCKNCLQRACTLGSSTPPRDWEVYDRGRCRKQATGGDGLVLAIKPLQASALVYAHPQSPHTTHRYTGRAPHAWNSGAALCDPRDRGTRPRGCSSGHRSTPPGPVRWMRSSAPQATPNPDTPAPPPAAPPPAQHGARRGGGLDPHAKGFEPAG